MKRDLLPYQIIMGVTAGSIGGIIALLGELRDELGFHNSMIGVIVAAGFLAAFVAQITLASWADRGYARHMVVVGVALSAVAVLAMGIADHEVTWIVSRALLGFGGGLILPGLRRAATVLDPVKAGENLGRLIVGEVTGFLFGPILAAVLAEIGGIRLPFYVFGVALAMFLPFALRLPPDKGRLDESGRATSLDLLRGRRLQGALLLVGGYFMLIGAFESVIPVMFRDRGATTLTTALAFTVFALPIAFVSPWAGRTADRVGPVRVATTGISVVATSALFYGFLPGIVIPVALMAFVGVADGFGFTAAQVAVSRAVPEERQAGALGLMGATEVGAAGLAAAPAAVLYGSAGEEVVWVVMGASTLITVAVARLLLRGTVPVNPAGIPAAGVSIDRHPPIVVEQTD